MSGGDQDSREESEQWKEIRRLDRLVSRFEAVLENLDGKLSTLHCDEHAAILATFKTYIDLGLFDPEKMVERASEQAAEKVLEKMDERDERALRKANLKEKTFVASAGVGGGVVALLARAGWAWLAKKVGWE